MRLTRLDLERYGPFTDRTLTFREEARLHLVFGRNEAGKSSALSAVGDLLFGFGHRTSYDFRHDMKSLRIGAEIVGRSGARLAFRRRKGTKNTLLVAGSETDTLPDEALAPFLGGLGREVFENAFGLSTEALRRGGEEMLSADGSAGAALLAAASGLSGLTDLRRKLDEEAAAIHEPNARKRRLQTARARLEAADKALTAAQLRPDDWVKLNAEIETLSRRQEDIATARRAVVQQRDRLKRQIRVAPMLASLDRAEAELAAFADLADLPAGFLAEATAAADARATTARALAEDAAADAAAREALAAIRTVPALVTAAGEIARLFGDSGAHVKDAAALPDIEATVRASAADLAALATRLGLPDPETLATHRPEDVALVRLARLSREGSDHETERRRLATQRAREQAEADRLAEARAAGGGALDPAPLSARLAGLAAALSRLERGSELAAKLADARRKASELAERLRPALPDPRRIGRLPLPTLADIRAAGTRARDLAAAATRLEADEAAARAGVEEARRALETLTQAGALATPERIAEARAARATAFAPLHAALIGAPEAPASVALGAALGRFEAAQQAADRLADQAVRDADRVAQLAVRREALAQARRGLDQVIADQERLAEDRAAAEAGWAALWQGVGVTPDTPARMEGWHDTAASLLTATADADRLSAECAELDADAAALLPELRALAAAVDLVPPAGDAASRAGALLLADLLKARLAALADLWAAGRDLDTRLTDARRRLADLDTEAARLAAAHADWTTRWQSALAALGLGPDTTPDEASAALEAWRDVPALLKSHAEATARATAIRQAGDRFAWDVAALAARIAPDLTDWPAARAIQELNTRLTDARTADTRHRSATDACALASRALAAAQAAADAADAAVADLLARVGRDPEAGLEALLPRLAARQALLDQVIGLDRQIRDAADGLAPAECRAEQADFDPAGADTALSRLEEEANRLTEEDRQTFSDQRQKEAERNRRATGVGAEIAAQERALAAADLAATVREWLVLKAGARLLSAAIDRRREADQNPVLTRASALFARLTGGAFAGLDQRFDTRDRAVIVGLRADGEMVPVGRADETGRSPMSEGTRDQMFLALRLAFLEDHARQSEPVPFLGDDLFTTFDDGRTAAGLSVLAEIGASVQPILFTHHAHVVELARDQLGDAVDVIELGTG